VNDDEYPSVPVAWCEIHNHEAATCECPEGAYEARHADCATVGQTCIAHTERPPSVPVESGDTSRYAHAIGHALLMAADDFAADDWISITASEATRAVLAVRDTEMEQLRALVSALQDARDSLVDERDDAYDQRDEAWRVVAQVNNNHGDFAAALGLSRDAYGDEIIATARQLAGLRERTVILTKRVRYAYDGDTWDGWLVTLTVAETGTQATVRRDNGEDWVVMARNITEIAAPEPATPAAPRAVILPNDWQSQLDGVIEPGDLVGQPDVVALIESWRAAPEPAKATERDPQAIYESLIQGAAVVNGVRNGGRVEQGDGGERP
jgi:hypothetical protein